MKKIIALVLCVMFILACALPATAATTVTTKKVKLTYASLQGVSDKDQMGVIIKDYTAKHKNVTVSGQVIDSSTYNTKLAIMSKAKTLPDIFWWNGNMLVDCYNTAKSVTDLTSYYTSSGLINDVTKAGLINMKTKDGKIVGFPAESQVQAWVFNKALFDKYKLKIPTTFDQLKAVTKVFAANNVVTIAQGTKDGGTPQWALDNWLALWGVFDDANKIFGTRELTIANSNVANAFKAMGEIADLGAFPKHNSTMGLESGITLFLSGKAAMISLPSDQLGKVVGKPVEKTCVYAWGPTFPNSPYDQKRQVAGVGNGYGVSVAAGKNADKMSVIMDMQKFRFSEAGIKLTLKTGMILPATLNTKINLSSFGNIIAGQAKLIGDPKANLQPEWTAYSYYNVWDQNWEAFGSKFNAVDVALINGIIDGSIKSSDIPAKLVKMDATIDEINKAWKATKK